MRRITLLICIGASACSRCGDAPEPEPELEAFAPEPPPPVAASRAVATPASFDLVASGSGALLVWGEPAGPVKLVVLDASGSERGDERVVWEEADASAVEVAAASGGGRVGIAWVARDDGGLTAMATHGPATAEAFAPPTNLGGVDNSIGGVDTSIGERSEPDAERSEASRGGPARASATRGVRGVPPRRGGLAGGEAPPNSIKMRGVRGVPPRRGDLAEAEAPPNSIKAPDADSTHSLLAMAAAEDGSVAVLHRQRDAPCPPGTAAGAADRTCAQFDIHRLGGTSNRRGAGLVAPDPCARSAVGYVWTAGVWYYGVCTHRDGVKVTTVYAIQFEPQYAHAEAVLEGCDPLGIARGEAGALVAGRCGSTLGVVSLTEAAQRRRDIRRARPSVTCVDAEGRDRGPGRDRRAHALGPGESTRSDPSA